MVKMKKKKKKDRVIGDRKVPTKFKGKLNMLVYAIFYGSKCWALKV